MIWFIAWCLIGILFYAYTFPRTEPMMRLPRWFYVPFMIVYLIVSGPIIWVVWLSVWLDCRRANRKSERKEYDDDG